MNNNILEYLQFPVLINEEYAFFITATLGSY